MPPPPGPEAPPYDAGLMAPSEDGTEPPPHASWSHYRPPWDFSGPNRQSDHSAAASEAELRLPSIAKTMSPSMLLQHLEKLTSQLALTSRRIDRTFGVLDDATSHAQMRANEAAGSGADDVRPNVGMMRPDECRLLDAVERVGFEAERTLDAMVAARAILDSLAARLTSCTTQLGQYSSEITELLKKLKPPHPSSKEAAKGMPRSSASHLDLFQVQASAQAASVLDAEVLATCKRMLEAVQQHCVKLERACGVRALRLQHLLASPERKAPAERLRAAQIGLEQFVEAVSSVGRRAPGGGSADAPMHLLRGTYPSAGEPPPPHRQTTLCNTFGGELSQGDLLMQRKLKRERVQAARAAMATIVMDEGQAAPMPGGASAEEVRAVSC